MKTIFLFLVALGLCHGHVLSHGQPVQTQNLDDLFQQLVAFIPLDKCVEIVNRYVQNDPDVKKAYDFLRSDSFESLLTDLEQLPEYKKFVQYLYDSGFDYYKYLNIIRSVLNLPPRPRPPTRAVREDPGLVKMIKEILGTFPIDDMRKWFVTICVPDPDFQTLLARIRAPEFMTLVDYVYKSQQYKEMKQMLLDQGIDVDKIEEEIADFLNNARMGSNGIKRVSSRNLNILLDEFLSFIPTADILEIFLDYVHKNDDIKNIIAYLKGDEFRALVVKIEALQELKNFLVALYGYGLDIYRAINLVLDLLGLPNVTPINGFPSTQSGLTEMVDKMIALLPLDKIANWYFTKCEPNPEFQDVLARMRRDEFKVIVTTVKEDPAFATIRQGLIDLDVDVTVIESFLHSYFGW